MKTCLDCVHYELCDHLENAHIGKDADKACAFFKDRSLSVEFPCKVGDVVYQTDGVRIYESTIRKVIFETESIAFDERAIGNSVFLSREDAEKALENK